ncbi:hypothetical protein [Streptacidiphilus sp. MAP12-16]|uniref:hypothetical protein n=1 Tax=Streptacidiphilus sp. MAP12-16 TaxID=3156300 RepID=UPI0035126DCE
MGFVFLVVAVLLLPGPAGSGTVPGSSPGSTVDIAGIITAATGLISAIAGLITAIAALRVARAPQPPAVTAQPGGFGPPPIMGAPWPAQSSQQTSLSPPGANPWHMPPASPYPPAGPPN